MKIRRIGPGLRALALVALLGGCGQGEVDERGGGSPAAMPMGSAMADMPGESCSLAETTDIRVAERAGIVPEDFRAMGEKNRGYRPGRIVDLDVTADGRVLALDEQLARVWTFSPDLALTGSWGGRGGGPGEFRSPRGLAVSPSDGTVWIADDGPPRLVHFDAEGSQLDVIPLPASPASLHLLEDGSILVGHEVMAPMLTMRPGRPFPAVLRVYPGEPSMDTVLAFDAHDLGERPLLTPSTSVRFGTGRDVVIAFPESNTLMVWEPGSGVTTTVDGCLTDAVEGFYREQLGGEPPYGWLVLVAAAHRSVDGGVRTVSSFPDARDRYHVDVYGADGGPERSLTFAAEPLNLLSEGIFLDDGEALLLFDLSGTIGILDLGVP